MATEPSTTRRALFAAAPTAAVIAATPAIASSTRMTALLHERNALVDWINAEPDWGAELEAERDAIHDRIFAMEDQIMDAVPTPDAVRAKIGLALKYNDDGAELHHDCITRMLREALAVWGGV